MEITLLVPTMNRSEFVIRLLHYYNEAGFKGCICVGDSSDAEHVERARRAIKALQGKLNIVYQEYPHFNNAECIERLLDFVPTPYAALVPDDDFLVPTALEQCVMFLERHPDYSAAHGVAAFVAVQSNEAHSRVVGGGRYRQPVIGAKSASHRLLEHLSNYSVTLFSVHRLESWREMYRDSSLLADRAFVQELLPCCISVILGKVKDLDCLYLIRQDHAGRYLSPVIYDWVTSPNWLPSYEIFRDRLSEELARQDGISGDQAREVVKEAFWSYLARSLNQKWEGRYGQAGADYRQRLRRAARGIPGLRRAWSGFRSFLPGDNNQMSLQALLRRSSPYHDDFMPIYRAITMRPTSLDASMQQGRAGVH